VEAQITRGGGKILLSSTEITVYLGNGTREAHGYYGTLRRSQEVADRYVSVLMTSSDL